MRRLVLGLLIVLLLSGCSAEDAAMDRAMLIRKNMLERGCSFDAVITADYGDVVHVFQMNCTADTEGNMRFCVVEPESISGITGEFSATGGKLTFDNEVLLFETLADGQLSPVSAPWIMLRTLQGGYIHACGRDGDGLKLQIYDSYRDDALQLDIWTNDTDIPIGAEIVYAGRRILSLNVKNFHFL